MDVINIYCPSRPRLSTSHTSGGGWGGFRRPKPVLIVGALIEHVIAKSRRIRSDIVEYIYNLYSIPYIPG